MTAERGYWTYRDGREEPFCPDGCRCPQCAWEAVYDELTTPLSALIDRIEPPWAYSMFDASAAARAAATHIAEQVEANLSRARSTEVPDA